MTAIRLSLAALVVVSLSACSAGVRFRDEPPVVRVDEGDIDEPEERKYLPISYFADILAFERLDRTLELKTSRPAMDVNALDEVPDSSWFENRIGARPVSPAEAARGPGGEPPKLPLTVVRGKSGGGNPGFIVKDAAGRSFLVKFDPPHDYELQTAADAITCRFLWAAGYHVPSDHVFVFRRDQISIAPRAQDTNEKGEKQPFDAASLERVLSQVPAAPPGAGERPAEGGARAFRAIASELLPGKPKGGFSASGTRKDDPNDRIPHEHRRSLRGLRVLAAWLDHTDMKEDNTLDVYVTERGRRHLRHYLVDFGESLGGHAAEKGRMEDGYEHVWDWAEQARAAVSLGLWKRPWEDRAPSPRRSIGPITTDLFDPASWKEAYPYWPFAEMDAADAFWGAKIVSRFDRATIEAVVETGKISDPVARALLVDALMARRAKIARAFLDAVTPLDELSIEGGFLCGVDLAQRHGAAREGSIERVGEHGETLETRVIGDDARGCVRLEPSPYVVYRLRVRRGPDPRPAMEVHVRDTARVVGIVRVAP